MGKNKTLKPQLFNGFFRTTFAAGFRKSFEVSLEGNVYVPYLEKRRQNSKQNHNTVRCYLSRIMREWVSALYYKNGSCQRGQTILAYVWSVIWRTIESTICNTLRPFQQHSTKHAILSYKVILLEYTREFLLAGKIGSFNLRGGRPTGTNAVTESSLIIKFWRVDECKHKWSVMNFITFAVGMCVYSRVNADLMNH